MRPFIDGDGSPVRGDVIKSGKSCGFDVVIVISVDHYTTKEYANHIRIVYVDRGAGSADCKIVGMVKENGFLITRDYGLASLVLPKGVRVFHHSGREFGEANIGTLLERRHRSGKLRKADIRTKGPKSFMEKDYMFFRRALEKAID